MQTRAFLAAAIAVTFFSISSLSHAYEQGQRFMRFGIAHVSPNDDSGDVKAFPGNGVSVDGDTGFGFSISHMVRDNWGVELLAALPFEHDINGEGPTLSGLGTIATTKHLPPTLLLNYYPQVNLPGWHPYIGAGLNYTTFFDEDASSSLEAALGKTRIKLDDSFGLALQAGVDWDWRDDWFVNAALWYIQIDTTADIKFSGGRTEVDVDIDPWVAMVGLGYRF